MSALLLKQARVIDPGGPYHNKVVDILINKGRIEKIGARIPAGKERVVESDNLHVSLGWYDTSAHFREPGNEQKETIRSGLDAAAAGGFTAVNALPSTDPFTDSNSAVEFMLNTAKGHSVQLYPLGALSKGGNGEQLAELFDMHKSGAIGFTDDGSIPNTRLVMLALQYQKQFNSTVVVYPSDMDLATGGQMHEGVESVRAGMKGLPAIAEEIQLARDLRLQAYSGGHLHVGTVSTAAGVALIKEAKQQGANVTCAVAAHNLLFTDAAVSGFDSRYKMMPPLRSKDHVDALIAGLKDGTIDGICSDHRPEDVEHKILEFDQAAFGACTIEHAFAAANTALRMHMKIGAIVERFSHGPRKAFRLPLTRIQKGEPAELTYFDPTLSYFAETKYSKGVASPYEGMELVGKVLGTCHA
jgi:dihydroorotase